MIAASHIVGWVPGPLEIAVILLVALIFFGRRLPDVARSLGKSIVEFKKGIKGVEDDIDQAVGKDTPKSLPGEQTAKPVTPERQRDESSENAA